MDMIGNKETTCMYCGNVLLYKEARMIEGDPYCKGSCSSDTFICYVCHVEKFAYNMGGVIGKTPYDTNISAENNKILCTDCYYKKGGTCTACNKSFYINDLHEEDDRAYCDDCYNKYYITCEGCGDTVDKHCVKYDDGYPFCKECYRPPSKELADIISDYKDVDCIKVFKRSNRYKTSKEYYFGLECEYVFTDQDRITRNDIFNYIEVIEELYKDKIALPKRDDTVDIEFTFPPSTYNELVDRINVFCPKIDKLGIFSEDDKAGVHVHIGKRYLSKLNWDKISYFINHPRNCIFIDKIAGRKQNMYCRRLTNIRFDWKKDGERRISLNKDTREKNTMEFRLFRSSLCPDTIKGYLQFIISLMEWVPNISYNSIMLEDYITFVKHHKKQFEELFDKIMTLEAYGIIQESIEKEEMISSSNHYITINRGSETFDNVSKAWGEGFYQKRKMLEKTH